MYVKLQGLCITQEDCERIKLAKSPAAKKRAIAKVIGEYSNSDVDEEQSERKEKKQPKEKGKKKDGKGRDGLEDHQMERDEDDEGEEEKGGGAELPLNLIVPLEDAIDQVVTESLGE